MPVSMMILVVLSTYLAMVGAAGSASCLCRHGTPFYTCDTSTDISCAACDAGYKLITQDSIVTCEEKKCQCTNGVAVSGPSCADESATDCGTCDSGYVKNPTTKDCDQCTLNECSSCTLATKDTKCDSCNIGFAKNVAADTCGECEVPGCNNCDYAFKGTKCTVCKPGLAVNTDTTACDECAVAGCKQCDFSTKATKCTTCEAGFVLEADATKCVFVEANEKRCPCPNGVGKIPQLPATSCDVDDCAECSSGYTATHVTVNNIARTHCLEKQCSCVDGTGKAGQECPAIANDCATCDARYVLSGASSGATCADGQCHAECAECADNTGNNAKCTVCIAGRGRSDATAATSTCLPCADTNCKKCSLSAAGYCSECDDTYHLVNGACSSQCDITTNCLKCPGAVGTCTECEGANGHLQDDSTCAACSDLACLKCVAGNSNAADCTKCKNTHQLSSTGTCVVCDRNTKQLNDDDACVTLAEKTCKCIHGQLANAGCTADDAQNCDSCADQYALVGTACLKCSVANCITCDGDHLATCTVCSAGYLLDNNVCKKCIVSGCKTCTGSTGATCTVCEDSYKTAPSGNTCTRCTLPNCKACAGAVGTCTVCKNGYFGTAACTQQCTGGAVSNCADPICTAAGATACTKCKKGYGKLLATGCSQCTAARHCETCDADVDECTSCNPGHFHRGDACVQCTVAQCATCSTAPETCDACETGYKLVGNECIKKVCKCENGVVGSCPTEGLQSCGACNTGYEDVAGVCVEKVCICTGGTLSDVVEDCTATQNCASCDPGYKFDAPGKLCTQKECKCIDGTKIAAPSASCTADDAQDCNVCRGGFVKVGTACKACTETNCKTCGVNGICSACKELYFLSGGKCAAQCDISNCGACVANKAVCDKCADGFKPDAVTITTCTQCASNCATCTAGNACVTCEEGYGAATSSGCTQCTAADTGCKACPNAVTTCTECKDGYSGSATCAACTVAKNCETCKADSDKCTSCQAGYFHQGDDCEQCTVANCKTCPIAKGVCATCNLGYGVVAGQCTKNYCKCTNGAAMAGGAAGCLENGNEACTGCNAGFRLSGSVCQQNVCDCANGDKSTVVGSCTTHGEQDCVSCAAGFKDAGDKSCTEKKCKCINGATTSSPSATCTADDAQDCGVCDAGFVKDGTACKACTETNCETCPGGAPCTKCKELYFLKVGKCAAKCDILNCGECVADKTQCTACADGFMKNAVSITSCTACASNCATCTGADAACSTCKEGYGVASNSGCSQCTVDGCKTCPSAVGTCATCKDGYKGTTACTVCAPANKCKTCDSNDKCTSCNPGYFHQGDTCVECVGECDSCPTGSNKCATCSTGHKLVGFTCIEKLCQCTNGIKDDAGGTCTADDAQDCKSCKTGFKKAGTPAACVKACTCPNGTVKTTCQSSDVSCKSCDAGYTLKNDKCTKTQTKVDGANNAEQMSPAILQYLLLAAWAATGFRVAVV